MKRMILGVLMVLSLFVAVDASAQTVLKVPLGTAVFAWDAGGVDATHSAATKHVIVCGSISVDVPMSALSMPVSSVVPGPGVFTCSIYAGNAFGRQKEPNIPFPQFEAGYEPSAPGNPRLEVR